MSVVRRLQNAFTSGEISPALKGRTDIPRYQHGLDLLRNFVPLVTGGATRRPGMPYMGEATDPASRLVPLTVSVDGALAGYQVELLPGKMRFWDENGPIMVDDEPLEIDAPYTAEQIPEVGYDKFENRLYLVHRAVHPQVVMRVSATEWEIKPVPFTAYPFMRPRDTDDVLLTPGAITGEDVDVTSNIDFFQSEHVGTTLRINGGEFLVTEVTDAQNAVADVTKDVVVPLNVAKYTDTVTVTVRKYDLPNPDSWRFVSRGETLTANDDLLISLVPPVLVSPEELPAGITVSTSRKEDLSGQKEAYIDTTVITAAPLEMLDDVTLVFSVVLTRIHYTAVSSVSFRLATTFPDGTAGFADWSAVQTHESVTGLEADSDWSEVAWNPLRGYPAALGFRNQRWLLAGSPGYPTSIMGSGVKRSKVSDIYNFELGTLDDDAFVFTAAEATTGIMHLVVSSKVYLMTSDRVLVMQGGGDKPITPTNVDIRPITSHGCNMTLRPVVIDDDLYFASPSGCSLRRIQYNLERDKTSAPPVSLTAAHFIAAGIRSAVFAPNPDGTGTVWFTTGDGGLVSLTVDNDQDVIGWARHYTEDPGAAHAAGYLDLSVAPDAAGKALVWLKSKRYVGGEWRYFYETLHDGVLLDCAAVGESAEGTAALPVPHLDGETVTVVGDGLVYPDVAVADGVATLPEPVKAWQAGLFFRPRLRDLPPEIVEAGTIQGAAVNVSQIRVRFLETVSAVVNGEEVPFTDFTLVAGPQLFTGDKDVTNLGWAKAGDDGAGIVEITQERPGPITVLAIVKRVSVNG